MKRNILYLSLAFFFLSYIASAQTVIYQDNFDSDRGWIQEDTPKHTIFVCNFDGLKAKHPNCNPDSIEKAGKAMILSGRLTYYSIISLLATIPSPECINGGFWRIHNAALGGNPGECPGNSQGNSMFVETCPDAISAIINPTQRIGAIVKQYTPLDPITIQLRQLEDRIFNGGDALIDGTTVRNYRVNCQRNPTAAPINFCDVCNFGVSSTRAQFTSPEINVPNGSTSLALEFNYAFNGENGKSRARISISTASGCTTPIYSDYRLVDNLTETGLCNGSRVNAFWAKFSRNITIPNNTSKVRFRINYEYDAECGNDTLFSIAIDNFKVEAIGGGTGSGLTVSASPAAICPGAETTLTASPSNAGPYTWTASNGANPTGTGASVTVSPNEETTYMVVDANCRSANVVVRMATPTSGLTITPSSPTFCEGSNTQITLTITPHQSNARYTWQKPANTADLTFVPPNQYTVRPNQTTTYTIVRPDGCVSGIVTLTMNRPSTGLTLSANSPICSGQTSTITVTGSAGASLSWTTNPTTSPAPSTGTATSINVSPTVTTTYTATDATNCREGSVQVVVSAATDRPTITTVETLRSNTICTDNTPATVTFRSSLTGGTWSIQSGNGSIDANTGVYTPPALNTGAPNQTVTIRYAPVGTACFTANTATYTITRRGTATLTPGGSICATAVPINMRTNWNPTPAGGTFSGGAWVQGDNFVATETGGAGNYDVRYAATDGATGCTVETTVQVNIIPPPTASVRLNGTCFDVSNTPIPVTLSPAPATVTNPNVVISQNPQTLTRNGNTWTFTPSVVGQYTLTYTGVVSGCNFSTTYNFAVGSTASSNIDFPTGQEPPYCVRNSAGVILTGTPGGGSFSMTPNRPGALVGNRFFPAVAGVGRFTLTYSGIDNGCTYTTSEQVEVTGYIGNALINNLNPEYCLNGTRSQRLSGVPAGGVFTASNPAVLTANREFNPVVAGEHTITYRVDANVAGTACDTTITRTVTVTDPLSIPVLITGRGLVSGRVSTYCATDEAFTLTTTPPGGTLTIDPVTSALTGNVFTPGAATPNVTYTLTYSTVVASCSVSTTQQLTVLSTPEPVIEGLQESYCLGSLPVTLSASISGGQFSGPGVTGNRFSPQVAGIGTHLITYSVENQAGCVGSTGFRVSVIEAPTVRITPPSAGLCATRSAATLTVSGSPGATYVWSPQTNLVSINATQVNVRPREPRTVYTVTATLPNGCTATATSVITYDANRPTLTVTRDTTICPGSSVRLLATGADDVFWLPTSGLSASDVSNPVASPRTTTTYTARGLGACGVTPPVTVTVTVRPPASVAVNASSQNVCAGTRVTLSASGLTSYVWEPRNQISGANFGERITAVPSLGNTAVYTVTGTNLEGCSVSGTVGITLRPVPEVSFVSPSFEVCSGSPANLRIRVSGVAGTAGSGQTWRIFYTYEGQSLTYDGRGSGTFTLPISTPAGRTLVSIDSIANITNTNLCGKRYNNVTAFVVPSPSPDVVFPSELRVCAGDTSSLRFTVSGVTSSTPWTLQYQLDGQNRPAINGTGTQGRIPLSMLTQSTTLRVNSITNNATTCSRSVNRPVGVTVNTVPNISISGSSTGACGGSPAFITFRSTNLGLSDTVEVEYTLGTVTRLVRLTGRNPQRIDTTFALSTPTVARVVRVRNIRTGCSIQPPNTTLSIPINAIPSARLVTSELSPLCPGSRPVLQFRIENVNPNENWQLTYNEGSQVRTQTGTGSGTFNLTTTPINSFTAYRLRLVQNVRTNCRDSIENEGVNVSVIPPPTVVFLDDTVKTCTGDIGVLRVRVGNIGQEAGWVLRYMVNGQEFSSGLQRGGGVYNLPMTVINSSGMVSLSTMINTATGCTTVFNNRTLPVLSKPRPVVTLGNDQDPQCLLDSTLSVTVSNVRPDQVWVLNYRQNNLRLFIRDTGNKTVRLNVAGVGGSFVFDTLTMVNTEDCPLYINRGVRVVPRPSFRIMDRNVCGGTEPVILQTSRLAGGELVSIFYTYRGQRSVYRTVTSGNRIQFMSPEAGTEEGLTLDSVRLFSSGCVFVLNQRITILPSPVLSNLNVRGNLELCGLSDVTLKVPPRTGNFTYSWFRDGIVIPGAVSDSLRLRESGEYHVVMRSSTNGCERRSPSYRVTRKGFEIRAQTDKSLICSEESARLTARGGRRYEWRPDVGLSNPSGSVTEARPNQTTTYTVRGYGEDCVGEDSVRVEVLPSPRLVVEPVVVVIEPGDPVWLNARGALRYRWRALGMGDPLYGLSSGEGERVGASPRTTVRYEVEGSVGGCVMRDTVTVNVLDLALDLPNTITPNGDGFNDSFIAEANNYKSYSLSIFDRWGNAIWSTSEPRPWNGTDANGNAVEEGVYLYFLSIIHINGYEYKKDGTITVLR